STSFFVYPSSSPLPLPSFPTRRSSDLYICSFYINEMHVYVRPEIKTLEDLAGKKVSFNTVGSAANLTGGIVFDRLKINAEKVFIDRKSTRLNSSHVKISYAVFCLKKKS